MVDINKSGPFPPGIASYSVHLHAHQLLRASYCDLSGTCGVQALLASRVQTWDPGPLSRARTAGALL
jgi:hypothetical protein